MSQQFILLKRKRLGLGRRVKKDRQIPVEVVQACRTGFTRLVNVKQFRDSFVDVSKQLYTNDEQMLGPPPDLRYVLFCAIELLTCSLLLVWTMWQWTHHFKL